MGAQTTTTTKPKTFTNYYDFLGIGIGDDGQNPYDFKGILPPPSQILKTTHAVLVVVVVSALGNFQCFWPPPLRIY